MARKGKQAPKGKMQAGGGRGPTPPRSAADHAAKAAVDCLNRGDRATAAGIVNEALKLAPDHPDLLHLSGQLALMQGDQARGRALVERAVAIAPDVALFRITLGNVCAVDGRLEEALKQFRTAVRLNPRIADAHTNVGIVLARLQRQEEAESAFQNAARLDSLNPRAFLNLAVCNAELRRPDKAVEAIGRVEALAADPAPGMLHEIGNIYRQLGRSIQAADSFRRSLQKDPAAAAVWFALGNLYADTGEYDQAAYALAGAEERGYPVASLRLAQARVAADQGDFDRTRNLLAEGRAAAGNDVYQLLRIAEQYTMIGDFAAQQDCLEQVVRVDPQNVAAFAGLSFAPGRELNEADARRLASLVEDVTLGAETRVRIGFSLGNHYRYQRRYDDSFRFYRLANRLKGYSFDLNAYAEWVARVERVFTPEFFAERADWGSESSLPLLIVGMPRSGTTLTEQILSAHPAVFGAGEYGNIAALADVDGRPKPDFREDIGLADAQTPESVAEHARAYIGKAVDLARRGETRVSNKLPHHFEQLGLFGLLFPRAPVVLVERDPRDTLLLIFFQDFKAVHAYAYDLKTLGHYYRLYRRLVAHWLRVLANPVFTLQYEDLVADMPTKARELADFVGLEWDDRMLRFYEQERMVQTASKWQVRQKLYTTSVSRWKPYEKHLKPLFDALGPGL